jgi:uncharacterized membrane protein YbhN (UPF0104 family)
VPRRRLFGRLLLYALAAALRTPRPLAAAAIIVPALELASLVPLTPGNLGITSAVVALALKAQGVATAPALAVGVGFHALETIVGVSLGVAGAVKVFRVRVPRVPHFAAIAAVLAIFLTLGAVLGVFLDVS